jgi:hypothetical protein
MQQDEESGGKPRHPSPPRRRHSAPAASRRRPGAPSLSLSHAPMGHPTALRQSSEEFATPGAGRDARSSGSFFAGVASLRLRQWPPPSASGLKLSRRNRVRVLGGQCAGDVERVTWTNGTRDVGCSGEWGTSTWIVLAFLVSWVHLVASTSA